MRRGLRIFLALIGLILVLSAAGFVVWGETPAQPMPEALAALKSDAQVTVTLGQWLVLAPTKSQPTTGFIIYPGGRMDASRPLLPSDTTWVQIPGGDHAQFGWYGDQAGDNSASISRTDQQAQVVAATLGMLESLK